VEFHAGDCFLLKSIKGRDPHLHIVLCGAAGEPPSIVTAIVNTAYDEHNDVPVDNRTHNFLLAPRSHPFVEVTSVVNYKSVARLVRLCLRPTSCTALARSRTDVRHRFDEGRMLYLIAVNLFARFLGRSLSENLTQEQQLFSPKGSSRGATKAGRRSSVYSFPKPVIGIKLCAWNVTRGTATS